MQKRTNPGLHPASGQLLPVESAVAQDWPIDHWTGVTVLVAVSGGADSVALLRALERLAAHHPGRRVVAHFHHGWRDDAEQDAEFVRQLAESLGLECRTGRAPPGSIGRDESRARQARYRFLRQAAHQTGARYVATAHTADDQVETVLLRLLRGTGLRGLAGIPRIRPLSEATSLVRPLLAVSRRELQDYLAALGQAWREDPTNSDRRYLRNRIRHELLPQLESRYQPALRRRLLDLATQAGALEDLVAHSVQGQLARSLIEHHPGSRSRLRFFPDQPLPLRCEILRHVWRAHGWPLRAMGYRQWTELARLEPCPAAAITLPGAVAAHRDGQYLQLTRPPEAPGAAGEPLRCPAT